MSKAKTIKKKEGNSKNEVQEFATIIDNLEDEKLQITNQLKHVLADYQNLEKNMVKITQLRYLQVKKNLAENIIPVVDALTIALRTSDQLNLDEKSKAWLGGVTASMENLEKVFLDIGLSKFVPKKGDRFDPHIHEALTTVSEGKKDCIYDNIQPGYMLDGVLIRPARVVVSK